MEEFKRIYFNSSDCRLSAVDFGDPCNPDLVILHGMRDHALSMFDIVRGLEDHYHIVVPDLRGHGHSDSHDAYVMVQFVADLKALIQHCDLDNPVLIGHSLGGQIASRYSAIYAGEIERLVLLDGMGPPDNSVEPRKDVLRERLKAGIDSALTLNRPKRMLDVDEALKRLMRNNPLLSTDMAQLIVEHGIEQHVDGGITWRWDPAVQMIFSTYSKQETETLWRWIECPVLIVTGEDSWRYWAERHTQFDTDREHHESELKRTQTFFADARHEVIAGAGHMLHYDQPAAVNRLLRAFLDLD